MPNALVHCLLLVALTGCGASTCFVGGACTRGSASWLSRNGPPSPPKLFPTQSESYRLYGRP